MSPQTQLAGSMDSWLAQKRGLRDQLQFRWVEGLDLTDLRALEDVDLVF